MRYSDGDIASASQRILSTDPELKANIENLAQAKHRLSWLPGAAKHRGKARMRCVMLQRRD